MKMFKFVVNSIGLLLLFSALAITMSTIVTAQTQNPAHTKEQDSQTVTVSGGVLTFQDTLGTQSNQFETVITGGPATVSITVAGCMRGGTCTTVATSTATTNSIISASSGGTPPYDSYKITSSWTGGTNPTITFNRTGSVARNGFGAVNTVGGVSFPVNSPTAPTPLGSTSNCRTGVNPSMWVQDINGIYQQAGGVDTTAVITIGNSAAEKGFLSFCRPVLFNSSGSPPAGNTSFSYQGAVNIYFRPTQGTSLGMMGMQILGDDDPADVSTYGSGFRGLYSEFDLWGTPGFSGIDDGANALRGTMAMKSSGTGMIGGYYGVTGSYFRQGSNTFNSCSAGGCAGGARFDASNNHNSAGGSQILEGVRSACSNTQAGATLIGCAAFHAVQLSLQFPGLNAGVWIADYGTGNSTFNFRNDASASESGKVYNAGKTFLNHIQTGGPNLTVAAPTCASTGTGTSPSCALDTGSNDSYGIITITAGTTPGSSGTVTLTYNAAYGTNGTVCLMQGSNAGTGAWNVRLSLIAGTMNTASAVYNWDNNAVNLTAASTYKVLYHCASR